MIVTPYNSARKIPVVWTIRFTLLGCLPRRYSSFYFPISFCLREQGMATHKKFTIEEHVRWSDTDRAGIIYYGQFLRFFEIAETELFRAVGLSYAEVFERFDIWLPRVQIHFDFRKPLVLDDLIEVSAYVGRFGTKSLTLR